MNTKTFPIKTTPQISPEEIQQKLLTNQQIQTLFSFIDSFSGNNELKNNLKYIITDYNSILTTLLTLSNHTIPQESKTYKSIYEPIFSNNTNITYKPALTEQSPIKNKFTFSQSQDTPIIQIKKTNEILRNIESTLPHQAYYANKYTTNNDYKTFINNLITYKYSLSKLHEIKTDIETKTTSYRSINSNAHQISSPLKHIKETKFYDFDKSLRAYPHTQRSNDYLFKPDFNRFTRSYCDYFDTEVKRVSSPRTHKHPFE